MPWGCCYVRRIALLCSPPLASGTRAVREWQSRLTVGTATVTDPIGIPALFLMLMRQHSVPQLAYYKKARFVVLRMVKHVALSVPQVQTRAHSVRN